MLEVSAGLAHERASLECLQSTRVNMLNDACNMTQITARIVVSAQRLIEALGTPLAQLAAAEKEREPPDAPLASLAQTLTTVRAQLKEAGAKPRRQVVCLGGPRFIAAATTSTSSATAGRCPSRSSFTRVKLDSMPDGVTRVRRSTMAKLGAGLDAPTWHRDWYCFAACVLEESTRSVKLSDRGVLVLYHPIEHGTVTIWTRVCASVAARGGLVMSWICVHRTAHSMSNIGKSFP